MDENFFKSHIKPIAGAGFVLDPPGYERVGPWTHILIALHMAAAQLKSIQEQPHRLSGDMKDMELTYSRFTSSIVTYCRCFGSAGPGIPSLDPKKVFANDPKNKAVHDRIQGIRNNFVAHTDQSDLVRVNLAVKEDDQQILIQHLFSISLPPVCTENLIRVADVMESPKLAE
jgi:hypothetical protein